MAWLPVPPGTALGVFEEAEFITERMLLGRGDALLIYTDGVTEAMDCGQALYSSEKLLTTVETIRDEAADTMTRKIMDSVTLYCGTAPQADDITIMALRFKGSRAGIGGS